MAKTIKTAGELAELIMAEVNKLTICRGTTGVTIERLDDESMPFNWYISGAENSTGYCMDEIEAIEREFQAKYDLPPK